MNDKEEKNAIVEGPLLERFQRGQASSDPKEAESSFRKAFNLAEDAFLYVNREEADGMPQM